MSTTKVFVYFNLHRKCWSVKALEGANKGRVIAHRDFVVLEDATPKVSKAGRERVLRERRKNVHAGVVGTWVDGEDVMDNEGEGIFYIPHHVTYNPYKHEGFVYRSSSQSWNGSPWVLMNASAKDKVMVFDEGVICKA